jgi:hypothetical protein
MHSHESYWPRSWRTVMVIFEGTERTRQEVAQVQRKLASMRPM